MVFNILNVINFTTWSEIDTYYLVIHYIIVAIYYLYYFFTKRIMHIYNDM